MTEGKPLYLILKFIWPLLLGNTFQQLYNMVDTIIVGKYVGANALAAVGSTGTIMFLVVGLANGMATGFTVLTSQKYGAGDREGTRGTVANGVILAVIVCAVLTIISLSIMHSLLTIMNTPAEIYDDAYAYISTICMGIFALVFYNLFASFLRAVGNSTMPLVFLIFSAGLNVILDLVFILNFGMGVRGAALATDVAQGISAILCIIYIYARVEVLRPRREDWRLNACYTRKQLTVGVPMALQFGITASGTMVMQSAINIYGAVAVAGFTAAGKVQNLLTTGYMSLGQTMAAYVGQNYGKHDMDRINMGVREANKIGIVYSLFSGVMVLLLLPRLMALFFAKDVNVAEMLPYARTYIQLCVVCFIPLAMIFIYRNTIQGCGYGMTAMMLGVMELVARMSMAVGSMFVGSYTMAVAADAMAWLTTGFFGWFLFVWVRKRILEKWEKEIIRDI